MSGTLDDLDRHFRSIDGRGYGAYKTIRGRWRAGDAELEIEHVQGDPFATPSRIRWWVPPAAHGLPRDAYSTPVRATALADYLLRMFADAVRDVPRTGGMGNSGKILVDAGGAEILERSGCRIDERGLELRFRVGLPARGRTVLGRAAADILVRQVPRAASRLHWEAVDQDRAWSWIRIAEDHGNVQRDLADRGLVAFVRDGSVLPRRTGVASDPLPGAVPFRAPESLRVTLETRHHGEIRGMGVPEGVTLITGGGFHGKTTLLEAMQFGVYPHVPGDGREWVISRDDVVKVRSEDGRAVTGVDLRPFVQDLPGNRDTASFQTPDASGSTSLAAAILEALEIGAHAILLDEDTSATNLLIRDARMQELVGKETITPLIDRVNELHGAHDVSTVLVVGGSGDYLDVADRVILMEDYLPHDVLSRGREIAERLPTGRKKAGLAFPIRIGRRVPRAASFDARRGRREKVKARGLRELVFGEEAIDLSALEQLVDDSQARAIGVFLARLGKSDGGRTLAECVEAVLDAAARRGLGALDRSPELAMPRRFEIAGAINRLRSLRLAD